MIVESRDRSLRPHMTMDEVQRQRQYYASTAGQYDDMHAPNAVGLAFLDGAIHLMNATSLLEIGSGTGKATAHLVAMHPNVRITGLEPSQSMRDVALTRGIAL